MTSLRAVHVAGAGMIRFARYKDSSLAELGQKAVLQCLRESGISKARIAAAYCGTATGGMLAGQRVLRDLGLTGIPIVNVENACSAGSVAFREAWIAIAAGIYDVALVVGVEKLTRFGGGTIPLEADDFEVSQGMVMPALYAMRARRYMHEFGVTADDLAQVMIKNRKSGSLNPYAQYQKEVSIEEIRSARMIADPFTLLHCCPTGDGAAAVILCAEQVASQFTTRSLRVIGSHLTSGVVVSQRDMTSPEITVRCARELYEESGIGPEDIDMAEVHDAFTIAEIMYYEALGFAPHGEGVKLLKSGQTSLGGRIPVNPSGGLLSKGHPLGATGIAQIVEAFWQLRGEAGDRQVPGAKVALTHTTGGGISGLDHGACTIHVFSR